MSLKTLKLTVLNGGPSDIMFNTFVVFKEAIFANA